MRNSHKYFFSALDFYLEGSDDNVENGGSGSHDENYINDYLFLMRTWILKESLYAITCASKPKFKITLRSLISLIDLIKGSRKQTSHCLCVHKSIIVAGRK